MKDYYYAHPQTAMASGSHQSHLGEYNNASIAAVPRTPEIQRVRDEMEKALTMCAVLLDGLEGRLSAIVRPCGPQTQASGNVGAGTATPLGESMQSQVFAAERIGARLRDLLDRLEL